MEKSKAQQLADSIRESVREFWPTAEGKALRLRLDLAKHVLCSLQKTGWTQARLAKEVGWKDSFLSNVIHGDQNWTTETYGRLAAALGLELELREPAPMHPDLRIFTLDTGIENGTYQIKNDQTKEDRIQTVANAANSRSEYCRIAEGG